MELPYDSTIPRLSISPKELEARTQAGTFAPVFYSSAVHTSKEVEIAQMSMNRRLAKYMVYSYSAIKRRELPIQTTAWMNLKNMLTERSQTQKNTYSMTVLI